MRRLTLALSLLFLLITACALGAPVPTLEIQTEVPIPATVTGTDVPANGQMLEGPDINFNGIRFTLDPEIGSRVYVFDDVTTIDGATAHNIRFALTAEEYCQTWCLNVYRVAEFEQAFGTFVFPPAGYRGGAGIIFEAQKTTLSFQNGSGDRGLEVFGQNNYPVNNELLMYVFRGYRADKQYGIYVQVPIHAASLPDTVPTLTTNTEDILGYNQQAAESMNALTPADFTPRLDLLDELVASIQAGTP